MKFLSKLVAAALCVSFLSAALVATPTHVQAATKSAKTMKMAKKGKMTKKGKMVKKGKTTRGKMAAKKGGKKSPKMAPKKTM
jgi:hypothetical protein